MYFILFITALWLMNTYRYLCNHSFILNFKVHCTGVIKKAIILFSNPNIHLFPKKIILLYWIHDYEFSNSELPILIPKSVMLNFQPTRLNLWKSTRNSWKPPNADFNRNQEELICLVCHIWSGKLTYRKPMKKSWSTNAKSISTPRKLPNLFNDNKFDIISIK